jgi:magnesium-transporting ATPase (P-type)
MSVVVKADPQREPMIYVKGAPVEMLQQCDRIHRGE